MTVEDFTGTWLITTENSSYLLDADKHTITRHAGDGAGVLHGDGAAMTYTDLHLINGMPMQFAWVNPYGDPKIRTTTRVVGIDRWDK